MGSVALLQWKIPSMEDMCRFVWAFSFRSGLLGSHGKFISEKKTSFCECLFDYESAARVFSSRKVTKTTKRRSLKFHKSSLALVFFPFSVLSEALKAGLFSLSASRGLHDVQIAVCPALVEVLETIGLAAAFCT